MELTTAYHKLMTFNKKYTYIMKDGQIVSLKKLKRWSKIITSITCCQTNKKILYGVNILIFKLFN